MKRILTLLFAFPLGVVLVSLAITNRHLVPLKLDPFRPEAPALPPVELPFYVFLLGALIVGVALGGVATWWSQGRWRGVARARTLDARRWQAEADRLMRERDEQAMSADRGATRGGSLGAGLGTPRVGERPRKLAIAGR